MDAGFNFSGVTLHDHIGEVPLDKAYRLINHGPTVLVSAQHEETRNLMAGAWACALDFSPPKVTVVLDKIAKTRERVERSGLVKPRADTPRAQPTRRCAGFCAGLFQRL